MAGGHQKIRDAGMTTRTPTPQSSQLQQGTVRPEKNAHTTLRTACRSPGTLSSAAGFTFLHVPPQGHAQR